MNYKKTINYYLNQSKSPIRCIVKHETSTTAARYDYVNNVFVVYTPQIEEDYQKLKRLQYKIRSKKELIQWILCHEVGHSRDSTLFTSTNKIKNIMTEYEIAVQNGNIQKIEKINQELYRTVMKREIAAWHYAKVYINKRRRKDFYKYMRYCLETYIRSIETMKNHQISRMYANIAKSYLKEA